MVFFIVVPTRIGEGGVNLKKSANQLKELFELGTLEMKKLLVKWHRMKDDKLFPKASIGNKYTRDENIFSKSFQIIYKFICTI